MERTKVVVLNGSPKQNGVVSKMLGHLVEELSEGCDVVCFRIYELEVRPCMGCMRCRTLRHCVLPQDDAHRVADAIRTADVLIIGSPCYWANMNGTLKVLFDRLVYAFMGEKENGLPFPLHRGKRAVLVTACNASWFLSLLSGQVRGVFRALDEVLRWSGYRVVARLAKTRCRTENTLMPNEIEKCKKIARKLC